MTDADEEPPFHAQPAGEMFQVVDAEGAVLITCATAGNAEQFAALMNQAYRRGYKAGYRHGAGRRPRP